MFFKSLAMKYSKGSNEWLQNVGFINSETNFLENVGRTRVDSSCSNHNLKRFGSRFSRLDGYIHFLRTPRGSDVLMVLQF